MQHNEILIDATPKKQDIDDIIAWLKREYDRNGEGFYHNRNIIYDSHQSSKAIVLKHGEKDIGLVTWSEDELHVNVDIFVIDINYRGKGCGDFFFKAISEYYRDEGFKAIKLFCEPRSSERFWQKMGLQKLPDCGYTEHELAYYGILVDTASTTYKRNSDKIELWDVEPYGVEEK
jgi:GNAT superfamily N-acetyltransferase